MLQAGTPDPENPHIIRGGSTGPWSENKDRFRGHPLETLFADWRVQAKDPKWPIEEDEVEEIIDRASVFKTPGQVGAYIRILKELMPESPTSGKEFKFSIDKIKKFNDKYGINDMRNIVHILGDRDPTENEIQEAVKFMKRNIGE